MSRELTKKEISMNQFDECVDMKATVNGFEINCKLGLWGVSCQNLDGLYKLTKEALHYWQQYADDGEYSSIIGGKSVIDNLTNIDKQGE
jgi:hypothetical protein